jgi:amidohydrolase
VWAKPISIGGVIMTQKILDCIESRKEEIIHLAREIYENPETGFKEFKTAKLVSDKFNELGLEFTALKDIPGVKATIDTGKAGPGLAIFGELDSVICSQHPHANKETGAAHACGHNAQIAAMIGSIIGLLDSGILKELSGKIHFMAVPAEECIELAYREELREKGVLRYLIGKPELLHRGLFDDVDICISIHSIAGNKKFSLNNSANGCILKQISFFGKAAHAGGEPHKGINALYAANLGLMAINSLRETFLEKEYIRVHPIITKGGDIVSAIPDDVRVETYVRGKTMEGILEANKKVTRALAGGAIAMGAKVEIKDIPGFYPLTVDKNLKEISREVMTDIVNNDDIVEFDHTTASSDIGDLSSIMPVIQPYLGGVEGGLHSIDFRITDEEIAYVLGAKYLALTAVRLLKNDASEARKVIKEYNPVFKCKEEYFTFMDSLFSSRIYSGKDILD